MVINCLILLAHKSCLNVIQFSHAIQVKQNTRTIDCQAYLLHMHRMLIIETTTFLCTTIFDGVEVGVIKEWYPAV